MWGNKSKKISNYAIHRIVKIGVSGPKHISQPELVKNTVHEILQKLEYNLSVTPHSYIVVSALAEGSD